MAVTFGVLRVDHMLRTLTAKQLLEWERYSQLEPFGEVRDDYRAASIATVIANVNRGPKQQAYKIEDFLLNFEPAQKRQTPEEQLAIVRMIAAAYSASDKAM